MKFFALCLLLILAAAIPFGAVASSGPAGHRVLAFYYTWYGTPAGGHGWRHWDEGGHHPDRPSPSGLLDTGTTDHPPAPYDSMDPRTIGGHLAEARRAGIDGLIATWWGLGDYHDQAFEKLLTEAAAELSGSGRPVFATIYYEQVPPGAGDPVPATAADLRYLLDRYGGSPAFLRYHGLPVIFVYGRAVGQMSADQWRRTLALVRARHRAYFVGDSTDPAEYAVFDALHEYNPVGDVVAGTAMRARYRRLTTAAAAHHRPALVTVLPGYDDSHIGRTGPTVAPRERGALYVRLWAAALAARPDWVVITSFNEWHEGTEIEPSVEYGDRFLRLTSEYAAMLHTGRSVVPAAGAREMHGWRLTPISDARAVWEALAGGGIEIANRTGAPALLTVRSPDGAEPYLFEEGRSGRAWRALSPAEGSGARSGSHGRAYALPAEARVQAWTGASFADAHPDSPFAPLARRGVHLDVRSEWPASGPDEWRVSPDAAFPIRVTARNTGREELKDGDAVLWAPEGWGHARLRLFDRLGPGETASGLLAVRPSPHAPLGRPAPAFVWLRAVLATRGGPDERITVQNSLDLLPVRPLDTAFLFGDRGAFTLRLRSRFPGREIAGGATIRPAEGRSAIENSLRFRTSGETELSFHQQVPRSEAPTLRRTYVTLTVGSYRQLAAAVDTATLRLGRVDDAQGVDRIAVADGLTRPAEGPGRLAVPDAPGRPHYVYFKVTDGMPRPGPTYVEVEYLDAGSGTIGLQYDSLDGRAPLEGRYTESPDRARLGGTGGWTGGWTRFTWRIPDARFAGRQNGTADFRLAFGPQEVAIRRVTVSKWPAE